MSLEIIKELNIDFHDSRYISVNAKQSDVSSRYILVTCHNNGKLYPIDGVYSHAYARCRKPDDNVTFDSCEITSDGKILVELTPQMLAFVGRVFVDLVIVHNEPISPDNIKVNNGTIITNENTGVVSTMLFCINVTELAVNNEDIESSSEYNALNELLIKANEDYSYVMKATKISEENAKNSENEAKKSENNAFNYAINANTSAEQAKSSKDEASQFAAKAQVSEDIAKEALVQAEHVLEQIGDVSTQVESAFDNAILSKSYAVGGTNSRGNEDSDNSKYYYTQIKNISDSIGGASFKPKGTILFSELKFIEKSIGDIYHISNAFITDNTFIKSGIEYPAGTNIYYTMYEKWDCFDGEKIILSDDGEGNVSITSTYNFISTYDGLNEIIERVEALESQIVLGISE